MINTRQKGKELERWTAERIKEVGLDDRAYARGDSGAGNKEKTDVSTTMQVLDQGAGIECKFAAQAEVSKWWKQTKLLEKLGLEPILVYKLNNERFEDSKVVIYLDTFLELVKASQGIETVQQVDTPKTRKALHLIENAKSSMKNALKVLE